MAKFTLQIKTLRVNIMTSGWGHYYDMRDARRKLGDALAKLGWQVDDSKPVDEPQTDYFPSTSWYPEWAKKDDYTLHLSAYDIRKTHPIPKEANWVLLKGNTAITWGKNYRPAETVAQKINQFGLCVITGALVAAAVTDNPKIASLIASMEEVLRVEDLQNFTITFTKEKETKNCIRFQEDTIQGQPPKIGSLYVQKWAVGDTMKLKVTVEGV